MRLVPVRWPFVLLALVGCVPPGPSSRTYPRWTSQTGAEVAWRECAGVRAFVRKSGKQGIGVTLELRTRTQCAVTFARAELVLADGTRAPAEVPPAAPPGRSLIYLWTPIRFDGDAVWNRGVRAGQLEIDLAIDGAVQPTIIVPVVHS